MISKFTALILITSSLFILSFADDHNVIIGGRYGDVVNDITVNANGQIQSFGDYSTSHAEISGLKNLGNSGEVHGLVGANDNKLYISAGGSNKKFGDGVYITTQGNFSVNQQSLSHSAQVQVDQDLLPGLLSVVVGEQNLEVFAQGLLYYFMDIGGFDVTETASINWRRNYLSSDLIAETSKKISDLVSVFLRGRITNLQDPGLLVKAVLANTTYNDAQVNGYAQGDLSASGLLFEAIVNAYELINNKYDTNAQVGVSSGQPFFNIRTSFQDSGADVKALWNSTLTNYGLVYRGIAVAAQEVSPQVGGDAGIRFNGVNLDLKEQAIFGDVHYKDSIENGNVYANASVDLSSNELFKDLRVGAFKRLSEQVAVSDDLSINTNDKLYNRAALQGNTSFSNFLANYLLEVISTSGFYAVDTLVKGRADARRDGLLAGVRGFLTSQLSGAGAYVSTEGDYQNVHYTASVDGSVNSTKNSRVEASANATTTINSLDYSLFGNLLSDLQSSDLLTIGAVIKNKLQSLTITGRKNLRGYGPDTLDGVYTQNLSNGFVLTLKANKTEGRRAYLEGNVSRVAGTQTVYLYFSVDEFGNISFSQAN